jgi:hypothetical protein
MIVNSSQGGGSKDTWVLEGPPTGTTTDFPALSAWEPPRMPGLRTGDEWSGQQQQQQQHQAATLRARDRGGPAGATSCSAETGGCRLGS